MEHDGKLHIVVRLYSLVYNKRHLFYSNVMSVKCHVMSFTCDWCTKRHLSLKTIGAAWKHTTSSTVSKCQVPPLSSASDPAYCLNWKVWSSVYGRRLLKNCSKWQQVSNVQKVSRCLVSSPKITSGFCFYSPITSGFSELGNSWFIEKFNFIFKVNSWDFASSNCPMLSCPS